ncbi:MAG: hypothetical protein ACRDFZ_06865 [Candidatus Limnocylindria bacterium]
MNAPVNRVERLAWLSIPLTLAGMVLVFVTIGSLGAPRAELERIDVSEVLAVTNPAAVFGSRELQVVGWYANLADGCLADDGEGPDANWLERSCPVHLLLPEQPVASPAQGALQAIGLRLAAPTGEPFPPRPQPDGWHLLLEPLVVTGHFDDPAAPDCDPGLAAMCRNTFVVSDTDGLVH